MRTKGTIGLLLVSILAIVPAVWAADMPQGAVGRMPPRLSYVDGQVSFWRAGAQDWAQAQVNIPLAPGDELATGSPGNLELQIGSRAFVRAWADTQLGLANQEPDFLQLKVTAGHASFDLRALEPGRTVEVDTPNAAFTIEQPGYYRVDVNADRTSFITRRAGQATAIPAGGHGVVIAPSEEVVIEGTAAPQLSSYAAPELDEWDRWNYARTDALLDAVSARYVSPGTYGVDDLDQYGTWRMVPTYGFVWVPTGLPAGWVPYSTGTWILDPYYGWTWVDTAPWGWAPYHYGRWVFVDGFWAWAPGPIVARPVYSPALVAFFGAPGVSIAVAGPVVGWVALGWGEPLVPWWGPPAFRRPWWGGWGGPRVVNNVVIKRTTVVTVQNITVYRNIGVQNAVVTVRQNQFGHGPIEPPHRVHVDARGLRPTHAAPHVVAGPASFVPTANRGFRPSEEILKRSVVATRRPHPLPRTKGERTTGPATVSTPPPRLVTAPQRQPTPPAQSQPAALPRPSFGRSPGERPMTDRGHPPVPPRQEGRVPRPSVEPQAPQPSPAARPSRGAPAAPSKQEAGPQAPAGGPPAAGQAPPPAPTPPTVQRPGGRAPERSLPGEPASRIAPRRGEGRPAQQDERRGASPKERPNRPEMEPRDRPRGKD